MSESRLAVEYSALEKRIKRLRRIAYLISKPVFRQTFEQTGLKTQESVIGLIRGEQERSLHEWLDSSCKVVIEEMSARELHELAQRESVSNYKRMCTEQLRAELIRLRDS